MKADGLLNREGAENYDGGRGRGGCMIQPSQQDEGRDAGRGGDKGKNIQRTKRQSRKRCNNEKGIEKGRG